MADEPAMDRGSLPLLATICGVALLPALSDLSTGAALGTAANVGILVACLTVAPILRDVRARFRSRSASGER